MLPAASVAVYAMLVTPKEKVLPDAGPVVRTMLPPAQLSVKEGTVQVAVALQLAPALTVMLLGQPVITGAVRSATVTVKEQVLVLPEASVAV